MRKWISILLLMILFTLSGCTASENTPLDDKTRDNSEITPPIHSGEREDDSPQQNLDNLGEFSILAGGKKVSLMNWDYDVNLEALFGKPIQEETRQLGPESDTFAGSFIKEITFSEIEFILFSPKDNGEEFYILSMETKANTLQPSRNLH
jgi:hypothetical protein